METRFIKKGRLLWQIILAVCLVVSTLWIGVVPVAAAVTITSITPNTGPTSGGTVVTIAGGGLGGPTGTVYFGTNLATNISNPGVPGSVPAVYICTVPASTTGAVAVDVTVNANGGSVTAVGGFTYTGGTVPTVASVSPTSGLPGGGTSVTITGTNLGSATGVKFGLNSAVITANTSIQIIATSPAGSGTVDVTVTTANGTSATSSADQFTYVVPITPTVTGISPTSGSTTGGTSITITGTTFYSPATVAIGGSSATGVTVVSLTSIICTTPAYAAGTVHVTVTTAAGTSSTSSADQFSYTFSLRNVYGWGNNSFGQLGNGTTTGSSIPLKISSLTDVTAMAGGYLHSLALKSDGTVWTYGYNSEGELGNGTTTNSSTPLQVSSLTGVTAIAGGEIYSLALKSDGTVRAWGYNADGELGNGTTTSSSIPVQVSQSSGLTNVTAIGGGAGHSLALKSDNTVWAWGANWSGQLGNNSTTSSSTPVSVNSLTGVTAIAGGWYHSLALKSDGTVWAWGNNYSGQLGDNTTTNRSIPVQVSGLSGVIAIAGEELSNLALKSDGTVWAWGANWCGQLGNGTFNDSLIPVQVGGLTGVTAIAGGYTHSLALKSDGTLWGWGFGGNGQLGNGATSSSSTPVQVTGVSGVKINAGGFHSLVLGSPSPIVSSISPTSGPTTGGTTITVTGTNFAGTTTVKFGTDNATSFIVTSDTSLTAVSPAWSSTVKTLVDNYTGLQFNAPNDIVVRSDGTIYFTDPYFGSPPTPQGVTFMGLYRLSPNGQLILEGQFQNPNGLGLSPDENTLYMCLTVGDNVTKFSVAPDGSLSNPQYFVYADNADGLKVDSAGNIYVACLDGVYVFSPAGSQLAKIIITDERPTNCAFGGSAGNTLFITATKNLYRIDLPVSGNVSPTLISSQFTFTEGPVWDNTRNALLFCDHDANKIWQLTLPGTFTVFRSPANQPYALAFDLEGNLLTCEGGARRISRTLTHGTVDVTVTTPGGTSAISSADQFTYNASTTFTVTYNGNGSTSGTAPTDGNSPYNSGATVTVLGNTGGLTRTGYTFNNWNTSGGGGTTYAPGATFSISANTILYAQWTVNQYTISFDTNGGVPATITAITQNYGTTVTAPANPTKAGYTFNGWLPAVPAAMPASNTTCVAQWTASTALVNISVILQGGGRPDAGWEVPLTIKFFTPGTDVLIGTPLYTFNLTTTKNGSTAVAQANGITPGTYDISAVTPTCLINKKAGAVITAPLTAIDLGTLLEGNADDSNIVNITDFGILAASYGKSTGDSGYYANADFDCSGIVNITDFGLLAANYGKSAPVVVP